MSSPRVLAFAGSARVESLNKRLVQATANIVEKMGVDVTLVDLRDYPMPIYDGDVEASDGIPENAQKFYELMKSTKGFLIACPEYNSSITPLLKNVIDWSSRPRERDQPLEGFSGKVAALVAASPGGLGGLRGLSHVTSILQSIGTMVVPGQVAVAKAHEVVGKDGIINDDRTNSLLSLLCERFAETLKRL